MKLLTLLSVVLSAIVSIRAQIVTGPNMEHFAHSFGLLAKGWTVRQTACSLGANALWPDEEATFTFFLKPGQAFKGTLPMDVSQWIHLEVYREHILETFICS